MKKNKIISIYPFFILIAAFLMSIGYATVNSVMVDVNGNAIAKLQDGIFITEVNYDSNYFADYENSKIIYADQTMLKSHVILSSGNKDSSITYAVTIYNSYNEDFVFDGVEYSTNSATADDTYSNNGITFKLNGLNVGDTLKGNKSINFTITFYYVDNVLASVNTLNSVLNFKFIKNSSYTINYVNIINNNYPSTIQGGQTLEINFANNAPKHIRVKVDDIEITDFTYLNGILTVSSVAGNLTIIGEDIFLITNDKNGDGLLNIGDELTLERNVNNKVYKEVFYVISDHENAPSGTISLLAKYNLNVGPAQYSDNNTKGFQDPNVIGINASGSTDGWSLSANRYYGAVEFSSSNYWSTSGGNFIFNSSSSVYNYISTYETNLENLGVGDITVTLPSYNQMTDMGCKSVANGGSCPSSVSWVYSTSYWTGSYQNSSNMISVYSRGQLMSTAYNLSTFIGVRPVVLLKESQYYKKGF